MKIVVAKRKSKQGNDYYIMEGVAEYGKVKITFDKATIMECLPRECNIRDLDENGVVIGEIYE